MHAGGFESDKNEIQVCEGMPETMEERTIAHELIHAWDYCTGQLPSNPTCLQIARSELRAGFLSGDCERLEEFYRGRNPFSYSLEACARRRAILSLEMHANCKANAAALVDECLADAKNDKRPFEDQ